MLTIISPAKSLDFDKQNTITDCTKPQFLTQSVKLINTLKTKNTIQISALMKISAKLSILNKQRFINFHTPFTPENSKPAIFAFTGSVYKGINVKNFNDNELKFLNKSLRIISGLYGLLAPFDLIQPYRLEMSTKLKIAQHNNLYQFWGNVISDEINKYKKDVIINLASNEYAKVINKKILSAALIDIVFQEKTNNIYKTIGVHAKYARGLMVNFIVKNHINKPHYLKDFNSDNYTFNSTLSDNKKWVFTRY